MMSAGQERRQTIVGLAAFFCAAAIAAAVLLEFPPQMYGFYPRCPIHEIFHIECPGCGSTRAIAALLHGQLHAALQFNPFTVAVVLPLAALYAGAVVVRILRNNPKPLLRIPTSAAFAGLALTLVFTVFRNLRG